MPKWWRSGNCLILLSCETDFDADIYRYADVLRKARNVVNQVSNLRPARTLRIVLSAGYFLDIEFWNLKCVDLAEGEEPWGGVDKIGSVGSFYVSVSGRVMPVGLGFLYLTNVTTEAQSNNVLLETGLRDSSG